MMNKMNSARFHLLRFLFILPLLAILLLSFRENIEGFIDNPATIVVSNTLAGSNATEQKSSGVQYKTMIKTQFTINQTDTLPEKLKEVNVLGIKDVLYIVDELVRDRSFVEQLKGEDIASIDVLKGESTLQYGEKGKNGVIRIYTKSAGQRHVKSAPKVKAVTSLTLRATQSTDTPDNIILEADTINIDASQYKFDRTGKTKFNIVGHHRPEPLFIVDGVPFSGRAQLSELDPNTIESMEVIKEETALKFYGSASAGGVILITTKKPKPPVLKLQLRQDTLLRERPID